MALSLLNFTALVEQQAAAVQGAASALIDLTVGSVLRAILEANASIALWLQWLILQVLSLTRLATSTGSDVDSWVGDFTLTRLPASTATGTVTLARFSTASAASIPVGATLRTGDGSQTFDIAADSTNACWSAGIGASGGYLLPVGIASIGVPVVAETAGSAGNVQAGAISLLGTAISGIDTVNNAAPFTDGVDAETDAALRSRFVNFINTRAMATPLAIGTAVLSVQQGLSYAIAENVDAGGNPLMGNFVVTVDDGSGAPPSTLLATVSAAVDAVRPLGSSYTIQGPQVVTANVSVTITAASGYVKTTLQGQVMNALLAYIDALPIGSPLAYTRLAALVYGVAGVATAETLLLNGGTSDIGGGAAQSVKATAATVAVN